MPRLSVRLSSAPRRKGWGKSRRVMDFRGAIAWNRVPFAGFFRLGDSKTGPSVSSGLFRDAIARPKKQPGRRSGLHVATLCRTRAPEKKTKGRRNPVEQRKPRRFESPRFFFYATMRRAVKHESETFRNRTDRCPAATSPAGAKTEKRPRLRRTATREPPARGAPEKSGSEPTRSPPRRSA